MSGHLELALELQRLGITTVPFLEDGSKAPAVSWRGVQDSPATREQVEQWWTDHPLDGIGVVCGAASRELVMAEVEGREMSSNFAILTQIDSLMYARGLSHLWQTVQDGWTEMSPSGGVHWLWHVSNGSAGRNEVLARDAEGAVKIETRANGGLAIIAPSGATGARVHPSGKPWMSVTGGPKTAATISSLQHAQLLEVLRAFDDAVHESADARNAQRPYGERLRPGEDYNARATWSEVLEPHGWKRASRTRFDGWTRPGKERGISATTGLTAVDLMFVFSTNADLPTGTPLSKFAVYTHLTHAGDFSAAARALAATGYGDELLVADESDRPVPWRSLIERRLPPFPLSAMGHLATYVAAIARATETAPDLAGTAVLGAVAAVLGGRVVAEAPVGGSWKEPANLWVVIVAGPGEGKSPVLNPIRKALHKIELRRAAAVREACLERHRYRETLEASVKHWRGKLVRAEDIAERAEAEVHMADAYRQLDENPPIVEPMFLVADITPESLGSKLAEQKSVTVLSTEGGFFGTIAGRYSGGVGNYDAALQAWSCDAFTIDRKNQSDTRVEVRRPVLSMILTLQPTVILELGARADAVGRGMPARILFSVPESMVGRRKLRRDAQLSTDVEDSIEHVLNSIDWRFEAFENTKHRDEPEVVLRIAADAAELWHERRQEIEHLSHPDQGASPALVGWLAKAAGTALRLAVIVHYLAGDISQTSEVITAAEMRGAVELSRYFQAHAAASLDDMTRGASTGLAQAQILRAWIVRHPTFSEREIHQALKGQTLLKTKADVDEGLVYLADRGHIDRLAVEPGVHRGRPRSQRWRLRDPSRSSPES